MTSKVFFRYINLRYIVYLLISFVGILVGAFLAAALVDKAPPPQPAPSEACVEGVFMAWNPDWGGFMVLGDTSICGVNLHFDDIYGPSKLPDPIEELIGK